MNKTIIFRESDLALSIVALIGMYYLLDMDYPHDLEIGLTMPQVIIYKDFTARKKILKELNKEIEAYQAFVAGKWSLIIHAGKWSLIIHAGKWSLIIH